MVSSQKHNFSFPLFYQVVDEGVEENNDVIPLVYEDKDSSDEEGEEELEDAMETDQENEEENEDDIDNDIANGISDFEGIEAMSD